MADDLRRSIERLDKVIEKSHAQKHKLNLKNKAQFLRHDVHRPTPSTSVTRKSEVPPRSPIKGSDLTKRDNLEGVSVVALTQTN